MRSDRIDSEFHPHRFYLTCFMAALLMVSEAGAAVLLPQDFAAGRFPISVAVAGIER